MTLNQGLWGQKDPLTLFTKFEFLHPEWGVEHFILRVHTRISETA